MFFNSFPQHCGTLRFSRFTFTYFSKDQGHLTRKFRRIRHFPLKLLPATKPLVCVLSSPSSLSRAQGLFGSLTGDFFLFFFFLQRIQHPSIQSFSRKHTQKSPYYLSICTRALCIHIRALHILKRALYLYLQTRPRFLQTMKC